MSTPLILRRDAKVCRKSCQRKSAMPARCRAERKTGFAKFFGSSGVPPRSERRRGSAGGSGGFAGSPGGVVHGDVVVLARLGSVRPDGTRLEVHVLGPAQRELIPLPEPRVERHTDDRPIVLTDLATVAAPLPPKSGSGHADCARGGRASTAPGSELAVARGASTAPSRRRRSLYRSKSAVTSPSVSPRAAGASVHFRPIRFQSWSARSRLALRAR